MLASLRTYAEFNCGDDGAIHKQRMSLNFEIPNFKSPLKFPMLAIAPSRSAVASWLVMQARGIGENIHLDGVCRKFSYFGFIVNI